MSRAARQHPGPFESVDELRQVIGSGHGRCSSSSHLLLTGWPAWARPNRIIWSERMANFTCWGGTNSKRCSAPREHCGCRLECVCDLLGDFRTN